MEIAIVLGVVGVVVGALLLAGRSPSRGNVDRWAADHGVELTAESRGMVTAYLRRSRRFRWAGAALGLAVPVVWAAVRSGPMPVDSLLAVLIGYLGGAAIAEATRVPPRGVRGASLSPRRLEDYVPRRITLALRGLAVLAVVLVPAYALPGRSPAPWLSRPGFAALSVAAVAVAIVCEALQRLIVARRQPALSHDQVDVDDALRAASVHAVAGASVAMVALIVSDQLLALSKAFRGLPARWTVTALAIAAAVLAVWAWIHLSGTTPWRVRRSAGTASP